MQQVKISTVLSVAEQNELERCEVVIQQGLETFIDVGTALMTIRDKRLYRAEFGTFEDYCRERWGMVASRARQMIGAAQVVGNVESVTMVTPSSERQARPLTRLEPEIQCEVWAEVVHENGEDITAAKVEEVAKRWEPTNERLRELKEENRQTIFNQEPKAAPDLVEQAKQETASRLNVHFTSDSEEWYTPPEIVSAAINLFGAIDLDPCSNSKESPSIPAKAHYTKGDDGLAQEWFGKVYMNPPYGRVIADWVAKAADEYECGNVSGALLLVPARTDTAWMARVRKYPRCYVRGRLRFSNSPDAAPFPSCVVYLGDDEKRFFQAFSKLGDIYKLVGYE